ncbi:hypothetical protein [Amycolatopsis kentuckyensis]|uniref:hypothetical protein n=1 Tax=Amycolatopsis kentuckyensis TaxID=218823 RepID=UPI001FC9BADD|nr:hypothetical protein [Amycolatopsis kentuckyensis]
MAKAARQFLNEQVNDRLKNALGGPDSYVSVSSGSVVQPEQSEPAPSAEGGSAEETERVVTTEEELEDYRIVRAIVCGEVPAARVAARDTKTYFGVLLDDNNRKPIARLWFNRSKKYLGVFDENKVETRLPISTVEDIYRHADHLRNTVARYLTTARPQAATPETVSPAHPVVTADPVQSTSAW